MSCVCEIQQLTKILTFSLDALSRMAEIVAKSNALLMVKNLCNKLTTNEQKQSTETKETMKKKTKDEKEERMI